MLTGNAAGVPGSGKGGPDCGQLNIQTWRRAWLSRPATKRADPRAEDFEALQKDLRALRSDMDRLVASLTQEQKAKADRLKASAEEVYGKAREKARDSLDNAAALGRELVATLERSVAERPLTTLLAAFGVGMAIGHFLRRR